MDRRPQRVHVIVAGIVLTWGASASAEPTYQGYLDTALSLSNPSSQGCAICHVSAAGGQPGNPSLAPFGGLLNADGIETTSSESQFASVLSEIKQDQPKVYADLQAGRDPNPDVSATNVHIPEYGCNVGIGARLAEPRWVAALGMLALVGWRRRSKSR
jgi:hypothetical protein